MQKWETVTFCFTLVEVFDLVEAEGPAFPIIIHLDDGTNTGEHILLYVSHCALSSKKTDLFRTSIFHGFVVISYKNPGFEYPLAGPEDPDHD